MKIVNSEEMRNIDRKAMDEYGIPGLILMERAGLSVAQRIKENFPPKNVIIFSGKGNNGGDGLVVGRCLSNWGWPVKIFLLSEGSELKGDARANLDIASRLGIPIRHVKGLIQRDLKDAIIVDAIFGTGLNDVVKGISGAVIDKINNSGSPVVSVDMPSGISADTGEVLGRAVKAQMTVTFGLPKRGLILYPGAFYAGRLYIEDIGLPTALTEDGSLSVETIERTDISRLLPVRLPWVHKGNLGHCLVIAGSTGKTGAACMTADAALRIGAGLVTLGIPEGLNPIIEEKLTEVMSLPLMDNRDGTLNKDCLKTIIEFSRDKADVIALGPGLTTNPDIKHIVEGIIKKATVPLVIDADGINAISGRLDVLRKTVAPIVLTPHIGEMARLIASTSVEIQKNPIEVASDFAKRFRTYLVLKSARTVIASPDGSVFVNLTGNAGMATAGTGDVLTGMIAGLIAQGIDIIDSIKLGVYIHGLSGDLMLKKKTEFSLAASDLIKAIPLAIRELRQGIG